MADNRTRYQKLLAMANQTASPTEAVIARDLLQKLTATGANPKTPGVLSREDVMARAKSYPAGPSLAYRTPEGNWIRISVTDLLEDFVPGEDEAFVEQLLRQAARAQAFRWRH